jgi:hypothetical protein
MRRGGVVVSGNLRSRSASLVNLGSWAFGLLGLWALGPLKSWVFGTLKSWVFGLLGLWGPLGI